MNKQIILCVFIPLIALIVPVEAQNIADRRPEDIVLKIDKAYKKAKSIKEVEGIELYCRYSIEALSFKERDRLAVKAVTAMEQGRVQEANDCLSQLNALKELDRNIADLSCQPSSKFDALRRLSGK